MGEKIFFYGPKITYATFSDFDKSEISLSVAILVTELFEPTSGWKKIEVLNFEKKSMENRL